MTPRPYTPHAELRDVTLRDGLQLTAKMLPTDRKVQIIRELLALGVPALEIGSMARPDLVPPLADTLDVVAALDADELDRCWIWVATPRHIEKAAAAGARNFQYCFSASDSHNKANIGRSTEDSVAAMPDAVRIAQEAGGAIQLCIATAFTCPFEGHRPRAGDRDRRRPTSGAEDIAVCDTIGQAIPTRDRPHRRLEARAPATHRLSGHDTWGLAWRTRWRDRRGAAMVDGSLGGLGGCPFAPGASGNTSGTCCSRPARSGSRPHPGSMVDITDKLLAELGEPNRSKTAQGARSKAKAFDWVIGNEQVCDRR
jgi:hydroxymethylglutaryl-CoA lyase